MVLLVLFPFLLVLTVSIHYGFIIRLQRVLTTSWLPSTMLISIICGLFIAHVVEVTVYASFYYFADQLFELSRVTGFSFDEWGDALYFSFVAYSSLGAGDLSDAGWVRIVYGLEAINGLVLIAWSASFSLLVMDRMRICHPCSDE